ncbi:MAG: hypothetical protein COA38_18510 [Fluviicola sp.]|nr:MAG: hypothetical protein COA38_18510 [Fluviicola sp.]
MKNHSLLLSFLFLITTQFCLSQTVVEDEIWITIVNQNEIPVYESGQLKSSSSEIQRIIDQFHIVTIEAVLPDSRREDLKKVYSMKCHCNAGELIAEIEKSSKHLKFPEAAPEYRLLATTDDYNTEFSQDYALDLIDAQGAWNYSIGDTSMILGISDGNFFLNQEDLQSEYVNVNTWSTPVNYYYHGTAVAITAAGATDNGMGKSSIGYNCRMSLSGMGYNSILQMSYGGAKVINLSWAAGCSYSAYAQSVIDEAYNNGTIIVAAAGNGGTCGGSSNLVYPAALNHVIAVSSIGPNDNHEKIIGDPSTTHQHNSSVDICAPGYDVPLAIAPSFYLTSSGTSFAAPFVTGTIGLMLSLNPCLTFEDVESILYSTAANIDAQNPNYIGGLGAGRLDARAALEMVNDSLINSTVTEISCNGFSDGTIDLQNVGGDDTCFWGTLDGSGVNPTSEDQSGLTAGTYFVAVVDENGCSTVDTMVINQPAPWVHSNVVSTYPSGHNVSCYGATNGSIDVEVSNGVSGFTYEWASLNGSAQLTSYNSQDQTDLCAGLYSVTIIDSTGCTLIDTFEITQPTVLSVTHVLGTYPSGDHISCNGFSDGEIDLTVTGGSPNYSFVWSGSSGALPNASNEDQVGLPPDTYLVMVQDVNGCEYIDSMILTEPSVMNASIGVLSDYSGLPISCSGAQDGSILASINGGSPGYSCTWSNNVSAQNSALLSGLGEGEYTITIVDTNGCLFSESITLEGHELPVLNPYPATEVCLGEPVTFGNYSADEENSFWRLSNGMELYQNGSNTILLDEADCLDAMLYVTNEYGCMDSLFMENYICVHPNPTANFEASNTNLTIIENSTWFNSYSSGASEHEWDFGDGEFDTGENVYHTFETTQPEGFVVQLTVYNDAGCFDTMTRIIRVKDELLFYVPNAFTPNGDEHNNVFLPQFGAGFSPNDYALYIYNRWGEIVFESHDIFVGWDGTYNGSPAIDGAYSWGMTLVQNDYVEHPNSKDVYTGSLLLLR